MLLCYYINMEEIGTLYIVATPIGNMEDMTFRAVRILGEVDYVLCEDTRTTQNLLDRYDIKAKTILYAHSTEGKESTIINLIKSGKNFAIVSMRELLAFGPGYCLFLMFIKNLTNAKVVPILDLLL